MAQLGLETTIVDPAARARTVARFRERKIALPTLTELADPNTIDKAVSARLRSVDPDAPDPLNLFRVHWHNDFRRQSRMLVPAYWRLSSELTGVSSPILVALGNRFPMIRAHKVLAAYGCLVPRLVTGQYHLDEHRAVWPSTGNYCRGGVAISRILGCRGVAVLPEGMSAERFRWLEAWVSDPTDIVRTVGTESNVKEIYDKCAKLDADPANIIFNQFCEFGNHLVHWLVTGKSLERVFRCEQQGWPDLRLAAFVSATGSAGTIGAGDYLKDQYGTKIVAAEALECPTMLYNGYGEHNIQGIGDKHIPLVHNVMNTDLVVGISDRSTDSLNLLFNTDVGRAHLIEARKFDPALVDALGNFGLSSICNVLAAIKAAKALGLGPDDAIVTVATDGAEMYESERTKAAEKLFGGRFDDAAAGAAFERHLEVIDTEHTLVMGEVERNRVFNLGYYTWVEQQGVGLEEFEARRDQSFWVKLRELVPVWDRMIAELNEETGALKAT